jgi:hypothetical protein
VSTQHERALLEHIAQTLDNIEALLNELLDRPRPTVLHLSAYSKVQLERFARVLVDIVRRVLSERH